ncbi:DUF3027 domain-containing protein [Zhihengliuella sp.]|uniref:DUF3027 domain-containing protein n=1 Tax=Zhihengliuella sp. TaxID=1954483 RepID=UPI002811A595|nr:DUF3027 domain-containing protein [Zhihengliuella sp.]
MARTPKLDAVLAAQAESARAALTELVPQDQIGEHVLASAEGERLVMHRFEARVPGYGGWQWYVTLARGPRMKVATVCDSGLLPGDGALLPPAWVPWAERVAPEELEAERLAEAAEAAANGASGGEDTEQTPVTAPSGGSPEDGGTGGAAAEAPESTDADDDAGHRGDDSEPTDDSGPDASTPGADGESDPEDDADPAQPRRPRRRRRARRATRG